MKNFSIKTLALTLLILSGFGIANSSPPLESIYVDEPETNCEFGVSYIAENLPEHTLSFYECEGRAQVWLRKVVKEPDLSALHYKNDGEYQVVDYLFLGTLSNQEFIDPPRCTFKNSKETIQIVGLYRRLPKNKMVFTHKNGGLLQAWAVNPNTKRFELMPKHQLAAIICKADDE